SHELPDAQVIRADSVDRADGPAEHVVEALELARALDGGDILRLLDDADRGGGTTRVAADGAALLLGHVAADLAEPHLVAHLDEYLGEAGHVEGLGLQDVERDALGGLRADAGEPAELV